MERVAYVKRTTEQLIADLDQHCATVREVMHADVVESGRATVTERISVVEMESMVRALHSLSLSAEDVEALEWLVKWINVNSMPGVRPREIKARALALLDRLLAGVRE